MLYIYDCLVERLQQHLDDNKIGATIESYINRAWHRYRYIQVHPESMPESVYYEYRDGHWELRFECYDDEEKCEQLRYKLATAVKSDGYMNWHRAEGHNKGFLRIEQEVDEDTFLTLFDNLYNSTIGILLGKPDASVSDTGADDCAAECAASYGSNSEPSTEPSGSQRPNIRLSSVEELEFDSFVIPPYQRPYKWGVKNVNQLINDFIVFCDKGTNEYRLGTLVLHEDSEDLNIVDGQQRSITLVLLLNELREKYPNLFQGINIDKFLVKPQFHESTSIAHIKENINAIRLRLSEITEKHVEFLLKKCRLVVVTLHDISEAFQFFDSQNARGKELEAHDLLKAFHLREIPHITEADKKNILDWESMDTPHLANLFLVLFRIKKWIDGNDGREFTSNEVDTFKGPKGDRYLLPYQRIYAMAECYTELYNADLSRRIDYQHMDFPHQIDQITINGTLFFDMVRYYSQKEKQVREYLEKECYDIYSAIATYPERNRKGDIYTRNLFYAALMFYYDKFSEAGFRYAVPKIFAWAYGMRIRHHSVQLATMDNHARSNNSFFRMLHCAKSPSDVQNWYVPPIKNTENEQQEKMQEIIEILTRYKYYIEQ